MPIKPAHHQRVQEGIAQELDQSLDDVYLVEVGETMKRLFVLFRGVMVGMFDPQKENYGFEIARKLPPILSLKRLSETAQQKRDTEIDFRLTVAANTARHANENMRYALNEEVVKRSSQADIRFDLPLSLPEPTDAIFMSMGREVIVSTIVLRADPKLLSKFMQAVRKKYGVIIDSTEQ